MKGNTQRGRESKIVPHKGDVRLVKRDESGRIIANRRVKNASEPPKSERNTGKPWTKEELRELKVLAKENTPTRVIGMTLGRTAGSVRSKAAAEGISLRPSNQAPYGRSKR